MEIRTFSLDPDLTVAEIDPGTEHSWHFLPFEDRRAELIALDERYVLALGSQGPRNSSVAIFDRVERRRTNIETNELLEIARPTGEARPWCYAPAQGSVFVIEYARKREGFTFYPSQYLRQLSVDGRVNRRILIAPEFKARSVVARDDGRIVCVGADQIALLDPATGEAEISSSELLKVSGHYRHTLLRWFSPDGRRALRPHLGSVVRSGKAPQRGSSLLSRILSRKEEAAPQGDEEHPDLPGDNVRRFGVALDLFRLDPLAFERRLIVRYLPEPLFTAESLAILDALADRQDHRSWNGRDQLLLTGWEDTPETQLIKGCSTRSSGSSGTTIVGASPSPGFRASARSRSSGRSGPGIWTGPSRISAFVTWPSTGLSARSSRSPARRNRGSSRPRRP